VRPSWLVSVRQCCVNEIDDGAGVFDTEVEALETSGRSLHDDGGLAAGDVPVMLFSVFPPGADPLVAGNAKAWSAYSLVVLRDAGVVCRSSYLVPC
jgi:hypothetical protein